MFKQRVTRSSGTFLIVTILATVACQVLAQNQFKTFHDLLAATNRLESAELLLNESNQKSMADRANLLAQFAREVKTDQCSFYYKQVNNLADEYRAKAINYIHEVNNKGQNWFVSIFGGALNSLKGLSKNEPLLQEITDRYEHQASKIVEADINCDMLKFKIGALDSMLTVLSIDAKYLAIEDRLIFNRNIQWQLTRDKFMAKHNFYKIYELKPSQSGLLLEFYQSFKDSDATTIGEAIEHTRSPGNLIIGRLFDTCQAVNNYKLEWDHLESERQAQCHESEAESKSRARGRFSLAKYERVLAFCEKLAGTISKDVV